MPDEKKLKLWRTYLETHPESNFLQSPEWAKINQKLGHKVIFESFKGNDVALMIVKNAKRGRFLEIPGGPLIDWGQEIETDSEAEQKFLGKAKPEVEDAFKKIIAIAKRENCVFVRFRPQLLDTPENRELVKKSGSKNAPFHLHAQNTVIVDLENSEDDLLKNMRRQTRYEVRRAEKLKLKVESGNSQELFDEFHEAQVETAKRQNFIPPTQDDLDAYREILRENVRIYKVSTTEEITSDGKHLASEVAKRNDNEKDTIGNTVTDTKNIPAGSVIAYGLFLKSGNEAEYFEAASTELNHKLPGAYLLIWQAMQDYKKEGIKRLNLWGIAPDGVKNHRYSGVTTFKTGFGGEKVNYIPAQDIPIKKFRYKLDYIFENLRKKIRHLS